MRDQEDPDPDPIPWPDPEPPPPPQPPPPPPPAAQGNDMQPNEALYPDRAVQSVNGRYTFVYQGDSNLVLYKNYPYHPRKVLWASNTNGRPVGLCHMQGDGNLVIYGPSRQYVWDS